MTAKPSRARVLRSDVPVGTISRTKTGAIFEYDDAFLSGAARPQAERGIAYGLPYTQRRVETVGTNVHPFFAGLLPEGVRLRALVRRVKTSEDDLLSLLVASGADAIGDVSVVTDDAKTSDVEPALDIGRLDELRFSDVLAESLAGKRGQEPTLSGVQEKVSAAMISLPVRGRATGQTPRAYILKLTPKHTPRLVENEYFFSRMAAASGLMTARSELVVDAVGQSGLLIDRFDRVPSAQRGGTLIKVHQEDACQFLDRYPSDKYVLSFSDIARGIALLADAPVVELAKLIRLIAFCYLVANGDLHAKNVSLRTSHVDGRVELTPAYDVLSTLPYGDRTMALQLDGRDDNLRRETFRTFGERFGVRARATESILDEICDVAPAWLRKLDEIGLETKKATDLRRVIGKRLVDLGTKGRASAKRK